MAMKINSLEIENVKRIKAVKLEPSQNGLTIIGGDNNQGKTSVLDAIAWALGGDKYRPSRPQRDGSVIPPALHIVMNNGLVVERKGKNSALKVTDPKGEKGGQQLLNEFVEQLALDLPRFMEASGKEKAQTLLKIIGVGDQLLMLDKQEKEQFNERQAIGRIAVQKEKYAKEQVFYPDVPSKPVSAAELIRQQQEILAQNGENQRKRQQLHQLEQEYQLVTDQLRGLLQKQSALEEDLKVARSSAEGLQDQSTAELERNIADIDDINRKVRANLDKDKDFSNPVKNPITRDPRTQKQIAAYREKERNRRKLLTDVRQHKEYRAVLGKEVPKDFDKFREMKYNGDVKWAKLQSLYCGRFSLQERLDYEADGEKLFIPAGASMKNVRTIAGAGSKTAIRVEQSLVDQLGGTLGDWKKKVGKIESDKYLFDVHWYELNGKQYKMKVKMRKEK